MLDKRTLYEVKLTFDTTHETVKETYLFEAAAFADAEAQAFAHIANRGAFDIVCDSVKKRRFAGVEVNDRFNTNGCWFTLKINNYEATEQGIKKIPATILISAETFDDAVDFFNNDKDGLLISNDTELVQVNKTDISFVQLSNI